MHHRQLVCTIVMLVLPLALDAQRIRAGGPAFRVDPYVAVALAASFDSAAPLELPSPHSTSTTWRQFDHFEGVTVIGTSVAKPKTVDDNIVSFRAYFGFKGDTLRAPPEYVMLELRGKHAPPRRLYLHHEVAFLVNGSEKIETGKVYYDGVRDDEWLTIELYVATFARLATAEKLEARIGPVEYKFTTAEISRLHDLAASMTPSAIASR